MIVGSKVRLKPVNEIRRIPSDLTLHDHMADFIHKHQGRYFTVQSNGDDFIYFEEPESHYYWDKNWLVEADVLNLDEDLFTI